MGKILTQTCNEIQDEQTKRRKIKSLNRAYAHHGKGKIGRTYTCVVIGQTKTNVNYFWGILI